MGSLGLCITTFFSFLPSFFFILIGAPIIEKTQNNLLIKKILGLVSATIVGVILNLTIYLNMAVLWQNKALHLPSFVWLVASLLALSYYKINIIVWIIISAVMGMVWYAL